MTQSKVWAGAQIVGGRPYQEDLFDIFAIDETHGPIICLLADGMGGHAAGDVAAKLATEHFRRHLTQGARPGQSCHDGFLGALDQANRAIAAHTAANPDTEGMGCTLIAAEILGTQVRWLSVGDSLLYRVSPKGIARLNADHSMASRIDAAARRGEISWEEAQNSSSRNVLLSAVTGEAISRVDKPRQSISIDQDDWLILASDGLETLSQDQIFATISQSGKQGDPAAVCQALLDAVTQAGKKHQDNTTIIAARPFGQPLNVTDDDQSEDDGADNEVITRPIGLHHADRA